MFAPKFSQWSSFPLNLLRHLILHIRQLVEADAAPLPGVLTHQAQATELGVAGFEEMEEVGVHNFAKYRCYISIVCINVDAYIEVSP